MNCSTCGSKTKVLDSRNGVRRRECLKCGTRFSTTEVIVPKSVDVPLLNRKENGWY